MDIKIFCKEFKYFLLISVIEILGQTYVTYGATVEYGYDAHNGPHRWPEMFPNCADNDINIFQSPINIVTRHAEPYEFSTMNIPQGLKLTDILVKKDAHTVVLEIVNEHEKPIITGGPMANRIFKFAQIHFHWGKDQLHGSENKIDGNDGNMEMHIIFYNTKYNSFEEANRYFRPTRDALVVFAVLLTDDHQDNDLFSFTENLDELNYTPQASRTHNLQRYFHMFLPNEMDMYFTFTGSLTTPPCTEHIIWIVFWKSLKVSKRQMNQFRKIEHDGLSVTNNNRYLQRTNGRLVRYPRQYQEILLDYNRQQ